ncbi:hypothetical protein L218DRAFT_1075935 [Marasmius fiardii PR-910]|nr:hypothetical protein L218DRAFT_1075935 [Marasmius fiardii PR-910]
MSAPSSPIIPAYFANPSSTAIQWTTPYVRRYPMLWPEKSKLALAHEYCSKMELWKTFHAEAKSARMEFDKTRKMVKKARPAGYRFVSGPGKCVVDSLETLPAGQRAEIGYIPRIVESETTVEGDEEEDFDDIFEHYMDDIMEELKEVDNTTITAEEPSTTDKRKRRHGIIFDKSPVFDKF